MQSWFKKSFFLLVSLTALSCLRGTNAKITLVIDQGTLGLVGGNVSSVLAIFENETESFGESLITDDTPIFDLTQVVNGEIRKSVVVSFKATPPGFVRVRLAGYASADGTGVPLVAARGQLFLIKNDDGSENLLTAAFDVACGNGSLERGELCDDGNINPENGVDDFCSCGIQFNCGNGTVDVASGEECDDGNVLPNDGCSPACLNEVCGDGLVNNIPNEECDDANLNENDVCLSTCDIATCGDGFLFNQGGNEQCDPPNGNTCDNNCQIIVPAGCDGIAIDAGELCDGANLPGGEDCITQGFDAGNLACNNTCDGFLTVACTETCGDNSAANGEECDNADLGGQSCISRGFDAGALACVAAGQANECTFDEGACTDFVCGNDIQEGSEVCDGIDLNGQDCVGLGFDAGLPTCNGTCSAFVTATCTETCGDNSAANGELCDNLDFGAATCSSETGGVNPNGALACNGTCDVIDSSGCTP